MDGWGDLSTTARQVADASAFLRQVRDFAQAETLEAFQAEIDRQPQLNTFDSIAPTSISP